MYCGVLCVHFAFLWESVWSWTAVFRFPIQAYMNQLNQRYEAVWLTKQFQDRRIIFKLTKLQAILCASIVDGVVNYFVLSSAIITFSKMTRSVGHKKVLICSKFQKNFSLFVWTGSFAFSIVLLYREFQIRFSGRDRKWISHMRMRSTCHEFSVQFVWEMSQNAKITVHPDYLQITYENHRLRLWSKFDFLKW